MINKSKRNKKELTRRRSRGCDENHRAKRGWFESQSRTDDLRF